MKLTHDHKRCLAALASVIPGASTDQLISPAGGPAQDAGVRKAKAMHAKLVAMCDRATVAERSGILAQLERLSKLIQSGAVTAKRQRDNSGFKAARQA